ncbi:hypothetical protein IKG33_02065 [Candidatus Saccharibacteria bacterium]|nr:hypothetical protein [Candidatus Saccharibacteria bacterium]
MEKLKSGKTEQALPHENVRKTGKKSLEASQVKHEAQSENTEKPLHPSIEYAKTLTDEDILKGKFDKTKLTRTADDFHLDCEDYPALRQHTEHTLNKKGETVDVHKNMDYKGYTYVRYTSDIIKRICGEYAVEKDHDETKREKIKMDADHVIYLDKSGRPVQYLVDLFWDEFAPRDKNGKPHPKPTHSFANLDRISILTNLLKCKNVDDNNAWKKWEESKDKLTTSHFAMLRSLFLKEPLNPDKEEYYQAHPEAIMELPTILDDKKVMIVDEVEYGGLSMEMATYLLRRAVPEMAELSGTTFWQDSTESPGDDGTNDENAICEDGIKTKKKFGKLVLKALPAWYLSKDFRGRGIGDVDMPFYDKAYEHAERDARKIIENSSRPLSEEEKKTIIKKLKAKRFTEKYGSPFRGKKIDLGPEGEDSEMTRKLTKDMKQLLKDYRAGKIFPWSNRKLVNTDKEIANEYAIQIVRAGINPENYEKIKNAIDARPPEMVY